MSTSTQDRKAKTLQDLINQMQEDADRFVNTWSNVGDAMLRYQDNQKCLLGELARIFSDELQDKPVYTQAQPGVAGMGPNAPIGPTSGHPQVPAYAGPPPGGITYPHHPDYPTTHYHPRGVAPAPNGGYYAPDQGYPPQPYQEQLNRQAQETESNISQVIKNLRRQQS